MRRPRRGGLAALAMIPLSLMALFGYFIATFEGPLLPGRVAPSSAPPSPGISAPQAFFVNCQEGGSEALSRCPEAAGPVRDRRGQAAADCP